LYELRAGKDYYQQKERCVFCDILDQEERQASRIIENRGDYVALCPYAPRVPYETWIMQRSHEAFFEKGVTARNSGVKELAALIRRTLKRIRTLTDAFHLVLHTAPNTLHRSEVLGYWKTIEDDYHWHIEIMPVLPGKAKSYTYKEVYFTPVSPEKAAERLRETSPE
jgi:UDPglucose--hexose-1-phosphate uridylyltransferase